MNRRMIGRTTVAVVAAALLSAGAARAELNVPLMVVERDGEMRIDQPVTSGVPLPEGAYKDVSKLRLVDGQGGEVPCQFTPTVRWFRDKTVRWVLLDFQASVPGYATRPFFLRDDGPAKPIDHPLVVQEDAQRIVVTTGPLRFAVRKSGFDLIHEAWLDAAGEGNFDEAHRIVAPAKRDLAGAILQAIGFAYGQTGEKKYLDATVKGLIRNARGRRTRMIDFGNSFRSTGYAFWYVTADLPKKEPVPLLKWKR